MLIMESSEKARLRVGVGGLGAIGMPVARWLDSGVPGLVLSAVSAGDKARAADRLSDFNWPPPVVGLAELSEVADIVIECAPPALFEDIAVPAVEEGRILIVLTMTSLLERMDLIERASDTGARIIGPTGALLGFDAVRAASKAVVYSVVMVTHKPPVALKTAKFVIERGINLDGLIEPICLYKGSVRDAAAKFPANVNVAVALALAGIGPDRTEYEIWADPNIDRNSHNIKVDADSSRFEMTIAGIPTEENPATGKLTPLSVMATLEGLVTSFRVGS